MTVNAVVPGSIDTPFDERIDYEFGIKRGLPPGRAPEDVAGAVVFLASADAAYITGETVIVAGGWPTA